MGLFFPEWMPLWFQLIVIAVVVIFGLCFLLMPFSVFGLKSRLTYLDHQMEDIQSQLRVLLKRIPDARERLEFKLQPVATSENDIAREGGEVRGKKPVSTSSEYYTTPPSAKNRSMFFDPPSQSEGAPPPVRSSDRTTGYEEAPQYSGQERFRDRDPVAARQDQRVAEQQNRREEQLYDPPGKSPVKEVKQEEAQPRRRAEPILRWPPR